MRGPMRLGGGVLSIGLLLAFVPACQILSVCPGRPDDVADGSFSGIGGATLVFTGYVIRYVDAPELDARGYDLGVTRWLKGRPPDIGLFLRVTRPVPEIENGEPVMIIVEPGPRSPVVLPGTCTPLVPITEAEVEGDS